MEMILYLIGPMMLGAIGVALLIAAGWKYLRIREYLKRSVTTVGVVSDVVAQTSDHWDTQKRMTVTSTAFFPVVQFQTASGKQVEFLADVGANPPDHRKGEQVPVLYDPARPEDAKIRSFSQLWVPPLVLAIGGLTVTIISTGVAFKHLPQPLDANLILPPLFGVIGVALLAGAGWTYGRHRARLRSSLTAVGTVVKVLEVPGIGEEVAKFVGLQAPALVKFQSASGEEVEVAAEPRAKGPAYRVGEQVTVTYELARPDRAQIGDAARFPAIPIVLALLGLAFTAFGVVGLTRF